MEELNRKKKRVFRWEIAIDRTIKSTRKFVCNIMIPKQMEQPVALSGYLELVVWSLLSNICSLGHFTTLSDTQPELDS